MKRLIHAQCSSKLSNDGESEEAKANVIEGAINKLISLVHPIALFSFLFECGFLQVKSFSVSFVVIHYELSVFLKIVYIME